MLKRFRARSSRDAAKLEADLAPLTHEKMGSEQKEFHLVDYERVKDEISEKLRYIFEAERNALLASMAIYAWLAESDKIKFLGMGTTNSIGNLELVWLAPLLITILSAVRVLTFYARVGQLASYARAIETHMSMNVMPLLGWERYFKARRFWGPWITAAWFWIILLIVNVGFPWWMLKYGHPG